MLLNNSLGAVTATESSLIEVGWERFSFDGLDQNVSVMHLLAKTAVMDDGCDSLDFKTSFIMVSKAALIAMFSTEVLRMVGTRLGAIDGVIDSMLMESHRLNIMLVVVGVVK